MAEPKLSTYDDDLPRTLKRERAAREREARAREAADGDERSTRAPDLLANTYSRSEPRPRGDSWDQGVTVTRIKVPFIHLMLFFIKAVLAAIPALLLLLTILWLIGDLLQRQFPWLIKMRVFIDFPG